MKKIFLLLASLLMSAGFIACSEDDDAVNPGAVATPKDKVAETKVTDENGEEYTLFSTEITVAGTLETILLANHQKYEIEALKVSGRLNGTDMRFIRDLAGRDTLGHETEGELRYLDMSGASIVGGGKTYYRNEYVEQNVIGDFLFEECRKLETIKLPTSVKGIGYSAFHGCKALRSVELSPQLNYIDMGAFYDCSSLYSIDLPKSIRYIGNSAFGYTSVTLVYVHWELDEDILSFYYNVFENTPYYKNLFVPLGTKDFYTQKYPWKNFSSIIEVEE